MTINIEYETDQELGIDYAALASQVADKVLEMEKCPYDGQVMRKAPRSRLSPPRRKRKNRKPPKLHRLHRKKLLKHRKRRYSPLRIPHWKRRTPLPYCWKRPRSWPRRTRRLPQRTAPPRTTPPASTPRRTAYCCPRSRSSRRWIPARWRMPRRSAST